jgi:hypothetical protein
MYKSLPDNFANQLIKEPGVVMPKPSCISSVKTILVYLGSKDDSWYFDEDDLIKFGENDEM